MPIEKICRGCKRSKPLIEDNYHRSPSSLDGFRHTCKKCFSIKKHTEHKVTELLEALAIADKKIEDNIYYQKYREESMKYDMLVQDLKDAGKWPVKG